MGRLPCFALGLLLAGCGALLEDGAADGEDVNYVCGTEALPSEAQIRSCRDQGRILALLEDGWRCEALATTPEECAARGGLSVGEEPYWWACWELALDHGWPCANDEDCFGSCEAPPGAVPGEAVTGACSERTGAYCGRAVRDGVFVGEWCI